MNLTLKEYFLRYRDKACRELAWILPKRIAMWAYIRVAAHGTVGKYGNTIMSDLTALEGLKRWCDDHGI